MADERIELTEKVYATLCSALDNRNWTYEKIEDDKEKPAVYFGVGGDDIPMKFFVIVDSRMQIIRVTSPLPFKFCEEKRVEGAIAIGMATSVIANGCFDYDITDGSVAYRITSVFRDSVIGEELINYLINCACALIDRFNDKFLAIDKGVLSVEDFYKSLHE